MKNSKCRSLPISVTGSPAVAAEELPPQLARKLLAKVLRAARTGSSRVPLAYRWSYWNYLARRLIHNVLFERNIGPRGAHGWRQQVADDFLRAVCRSARNRENQGDTKTRSAREASLYRRVLNNRLTAREQAALRAPSQQLADAPLLSIVVPADSVAKLPRLFRSLTLQTYDRWELTVIGDADKREAFAGVMSNWGASDDRLHWQPLPGPFDPVAAIREGIQFSHGEYSIFVSQDAELLPDALWWIAQHLQENPQTQALVDQNSAGPTASTIDLAHAVSLTEQPDSPSLLAVDNTVFESMRNWPSNGAACAEPASDERPVLATLRDWLAQSGKSVATVPRMLGVAWSATQTTNARPAPPLGTRRQRRGLVENELISLLVVTPTERQSDHPAAPGPHCHALVTDWEQRGLCSARFLSPTCFSEWEPQSPNERPSAVLIQGDSPEAVRAVELAAARHLPTIWHLPAVSAGLADNHPKTLRQRARFVSALQQPYQVVFNNTKTMADWIPEMPSGNYTLAEGILPSGIFEPQTQQGERSAGWQRSHTRRRLGIREQAMVFLNVVTLDNLREARFLYDAFSRLPRRVRMRSFLLTIVHPGFGVATNADRDRIHAHWRRRLVPSTVIFWDHQTEPLDPYAAADILVAHPSHDFRSLAILNACDRGLPMVVGQSVVDAGLVRSDYSAIAVAENDPAGFAKGMRLLFDQPGLRYRLGQNGRHELSDLQSRQEVRSLWTELLREAAELSDIVSAYPHALSDDGRQATPWGQVTTSNYGSPAQSA